MKSTAQKPSLKKISTPTTASLMHTARNIPTTGKQYHRFNTPAKKNSWTNCVSSSTGSSHDGRSFIASWWHQGARLQLLLSFKPMPSPHPAERMRQRWGPWDGTGEMQPRLPARWGQHMSIPWGLIMAPEWWRHHHVPIWRKRWGSGPGKAEMLRRGLMCCTQTSQAVPGKQIPQCCPLLLEKQTTRTGGGRWRKQLTLSLTQTVKFWQKLRLKNHCLRHTSKIITAALF